MFNSILDSIIKVVTILIIPFVVMTYKHYKASVVREIKLQHDITDLKIYTSAICKKLNITCTIKDG